MNKDKESTKKLLAQAILLGSEDDIREAVFKASIDGTITEKEANELEKQFLTKKIKLLSAPKDLKALLTLVSFAYENKAMKKQFDDLIDGKIALEDMSIKFFADKDFVSSLEVLFKAYFKACQEGKVLKLGEIETLKDKVNKYIKSTQRKAALEVKNNSII